MQYATTLEEVLALRSENAALRKALEGCREALKMIIEPETIQETSTLHAWSHAVEAERKARGVLAELAH